MLSFAEYMKNVDECWQFSLDAAWDQNRRHPELSCGKCLRERSFFWTLLGTNQAPVFEKACLLADSGVEKKDMDQLLPEVHEWMEKRYPPTLDNPQYEQGRSFRYEVYGKRHYCYLHIRNAKCPESFLGDAQHVADNLHYIMDTAEKQDGCDTLYTATWLNSHPAFLRFFPSEWLQNLANTADFGPTLGWQGQFINRFGLLNKSTAKKFLETGVLPLARRESYCSFNAIRSHLNALMKNHCQIKLQLS